MVSAKDAKLKQSYILHQLFLYKHIMYLYKQLNNVILSSYLISMVLWITTKYFTHAEWFPWCIPVQRWGFVHIVHIVNTTGEGIVAF